MTEWTVRDINVDRIEERGADHTVIVVAMTLDSDEEEMPPASLRIAVPVASKDDDTLKVLGEKARVASGEIFRCLAERFASGEVPQQILH